MKRLMLNPLSVLIKMLEKRRCSFEKEAFTIDKLLKNCELEENQSRSYPILSFHCPRRGSSRIIFFNTREENQYDSIQVDEVEKICQDYHTGQHLFFVSYKDITNHGKEVLNKAGRSWESYCYQSLQFDIASHELVPEHQLILEPEEIKAIVKKYCALYYAKDSEKIEYGCSSTACYHLQWILTKDPMARYLNLKAGEIVKIFRDSKGGSFTTAYRICVKPD